MQASFNHTNTAYFEWHVCFPENAYTHAHTQTLASHLQSMRGKAHCW